MELDDHSWKPFLLKAFIYFDNNYWLCVGFGFSFLFNVISIGFGFGLFTMGAQGIDYQEWILKGGFSRTDSQRMDSQLPPAGQPAA